MRVGWAHTQTHTTVHMQIRMWSQSTTFRSPFSSTAGSLDSSDVIQFTRLVWQMLLPAGLSRWPKTPQFLELYTEIFVDAFRYLGFSLKHGTGNRSRGHNKTTGH